MTPAWEGLLAIDKPAGPTSHDIVARVRAATGCVRVGHTGTLDPPATGLVVLLLGRATRLARYLPEAPKVYEGELVLGVTTTTDDLTGEIATRHEGAWPPDEAVREAAAGLLGLRSQVPPAYSARHVGGVRLYRMARRGVRVEPPATSVRIEHLELDPTSAPGRWRYRTAVSAGTYVRAIVRDLGAALGCGAAVATLRRVAIGPFSVEDALELPARRDGLREAARSRLVPIDAIPLRLESVTLVKQQDRSRFAAGTPIPWSAPALDPPSDVAVRDDQGALLGVGALRSDGLSPRVVLARPELALPDRPAV